MRNPTPLALAAALGGLCLGVTACSSRTDVSLTGNTPAQYSHVWITTQEVWFNTSAVAGPDDGGWVKFALSTPTTVDLVQETGGNLGSAVTSLKLLPGTYSQIRFIPVDPSTPLTTSAQKVGALHNSEADYVDSGGTTHQVPLELLNSDKGMGIAATLRVPVGNIGAAFAATRGTTGTTTTGTTTTGTTTGGTTVFGATTGTGTGTPSTTGTTVSTSATTATASSVPNTEFAINFNGTTDLVPFTYGASASGILLSSHASAYDLSQVGGISGQLTLTNLTGISSSSGLPVIQATAQVLSADGTRHVAVASAPVTANGNFLLYPLAAGSSTPALYDVVIHGPGIATIIIKAVEVTLPGSKSATGASSTSGTTGTSGTGGTAGTTTATTSTGTTITVSAVSLGTLYPRAASSFTANLAAAPAEVLPAGALVGFYQTLALAGEVPYLIEASPIDPFSQVLANPRALSKGTVDSGAWTATGANVTVVSAAPKEGAGIYLVAAGAPSFADGALNNTVTAPPSGTAPATVHLPALTPASGTASGSISVKISEASAGKYNHGEVLVAHEGQLVAVAALDAAFAQGGGTVTVSGVPAQTSSALYYLSVRAWNSSDPSGTLQRQQYPTALDLRSSAGGSIQLTVN
jgi:hypothetical protein